MNKITQLYRSKKLLTRMKKRRSTRLFSTQTVSKAVVENCIAIAASAPSGANKQPWTFVLVSNPEIKRQIRQAAEKVEQEFYCRKITAQWSKDLEKLNVTAQKPFLEQAPFLICIFMQRYSLDSHGNKINHYYQHESIGFAVGFLLSALHQVGLTTLTYSPSPMSFLQTILQRPANEKPYLIIPVGLAAPDYQPPQINKKKKQDYLIDIS